MDQLGIEPWLLVSQIVNFLLLMVILRLTLYEPILRMLERRKERISQSMKDAERVAAAAPEPRREEPAYDDHDDRDHRKSGWSLFGRGKRQATQPTYAPPSRTTEMRSTSQVQSAPAPDMGEAEDDLEIPSFLRRLAN